MDDKILTLEEAAEFLKVSKSAIRKWLKSGKLKGHKAGRVWRFFQADLVSWLKENGGKKSITPA